MNDIFVEYTINNQCKRAARKKEERDYMKIRQKDLKSKLESQKGKQQHTARQSFKKRLEFFRKIKKKIKKKDRQILENFTNKNFFLAIETCTKFFTKHSQI